MKTNTKIGMILTFSLMFLLLFTVPSAYAGSCEENPNPPDSVWVCDTQEFHQDADVAATGLHFRAHIYEYEPDWEVLGYRVTIDCFPSVSCERTKKPSPYDGLSQGIDVDADGASIDPCTECVIKTEFWLNKDNDIRIQDKHWTYSGIAKIAPDRGWRVEPVLGGDTITIYNEDDTDNFTISGFEYLVVKTKFPDPRTVVFDTPIPDNFTLSPGENQEFSAPNVIKGGYVYFHYETRNATTGELIEKIYAGHQMEPPVGGIWVPVDKLGLLAPYIALASTILVATAATAIYVKRRKKKQ